MHKSPLTTRKSPLKPFQAPLSSFRASQNSVSPEGKLLMIRDISSPMAKKQAEKQLDSKKTRRLPSKFPIPSPSPFTSHLNPEEIPKILTKMQKNKVDPNLTGVLHRLLCLDYTQGKEEDKSKNRGFDRAFLRKREGQKEEEKGRNGGSREIGEMERWEGYYVRKLCVQAWRSWVRDEKARRKVIEMRLERFERKRLARYFNLFKSNVYNRKKQKFTYEINGLTQCVFDLQTDIKYEQKEKQKSIRALNSYTRGLKKATKLYNKEYSKVKALEAENSLIKPDLILNGIHKTIETVQKSDLFKQKFEILQNNQRNIKKLNFKNLRNLLKNPEPTKEDDDNSKSAKNQSEKSLDSSNCEETLGDLLSEPFEGIVLRWIRYCVLQILPSLKQKYKETRRTQRATEPGIQKDALSRKSLNLQKFIYNCEKNICKEVEDLDKNIFHIFCVLIFCGVRLIPKVSSDLVDTFSIKHVEFLIGYSTSKFDPSCMDDTYCVTLDSLVLDNREKELNPDSLPSIINIDTESFETTKQKSDRIEGIIVMMAKLFIKYHNFTDVCPLDSDEQKVNDLLISCYFRNDNGLARLFPRFYAYDHSKNGVLIQDSEASTIKQTLIKWMNQLVVRHLDDYEDFIVRLENNKNSDLYKKIIAFSGTLGQKYVGQDASLLSIGSFNSIFKAISLKKKKVNKLIKESPEKSPKPKGLDLAKQSLGANFNISVSSPSEFSQTKTPKKKGVKRTSSQAIKLREEQKINNLKSSFLIINNTMLPRLSAFRQDCQLLGVSSSLSSQGIKSLGDPIKSFNDYLSNSTNYAILILSILYPETFFTRSITSLTCQEILDHGYDLLIITRESTLKLTDAQKSSFILKTALKLNFDITSNQKSTETTNSSAQGAEELVVPSRRDIGLAFGKGAWNSVSFGQKQKIDKTHLTFFLFQIISKRMNDDKIAHETSQKSDFLKKISEMYNKTKTTKPDPNNLTQNKETDIMKVNEIGQDLVQLQKNPAFFN
ncbi:unnamed protein product [Moneuplotes crassus]|uniref:Uncharacterized protein n=2 Tax=Euplotes crassus TaxID=5936 RepID=A0AAD1UA10_EUPCR|nr:unnamed protein product [Moneuplotes crassus]